MGRSAVGWRRRRGAAEVPAPVRQGGAKALAESRREGGARYRAYRGAPSTRWRRKGYTGASEGAIKEKGGCARDRRRGGQDSQVASPPVGNQRVPCACQQRGFLVLAYPPVLRHLRLGGYAYRGGGGLKASSPSVPFTGRRRSLLYCEGHNSLHRTMLPHHSIVVFEFAALSRCCHVLPCMIIIGSRFTITIRGTGGI